MDVSKQARRDEEKKDGIPGFHGEKNGLAAALRPHDSARHGHHGGDHDQHEQLDAVHLLVCQVQA